MKKLLFILLCGCTFILLTSEDSCNSHPNTVQNQEEAQIEDNQTKLMNETPIPVLGKSLERKAIVKRLNMFEDENKVSYIYLISFGKIMAFYTVKGKVTSGSKRLTTNEKLVSADLGEHYGSIKVEAPSLDGTYGGSSDYIFFWTTDDTYIQWNDAYMLCDKPLKMSAQPELIYDITPKK